MQRRRPKQTPAETTLAARHPFAPRGALFVSPDYVFCRRGERLQLRSPHQTRLCQALAVGVRGLRRHGVLPNMRVRGAVNVLCVCLTLSRAADFFALV